MGVLGPIEETIDDNVPATPPDLQDLQADVNSDDDLFADTKDKEKTGVFIYNNDLSFKHIIPILPSKGEYEDILGLNPQQYPSLGVQSPPQKKRNFCSKCFEEVKRDLKKLAKVIENYKNERDVARAENESLKKEVEELKKILKIKEDNDKVDVKVSIDNIDASVKRENFKNAPIFFNHPTSKQEYGVKYFSVSLQKQDVPSLQISPRENFETEFQPKNKKTIAELRREFFAQEFESEQKTFTAQNYLEIKPEEKKETVKSRMSIKIKPKNKITEIFSKITSQFGRSKAIPEVQPITMFQRFEKTRDVWSNGMEVNCA